MGPGGRALRKSWGAAAKVEEAENKINLLSGSQFITNISEMGIMGTRLLQGKRLF